MKLQPLTFEGADPQWKLGRMSIDKQIAGDLVATTKGQMVSAMTETKGSAGYVAIERVTGTLNSKKGSFVLQHSGLMNRDFEKGKAMFAATLCLSCHQVQGTGGVSGPD